MLIKEYVKYWFYTYRMPHQARNTQETTWNLIRNHIVDSSLGERELTEVTVKELQEFLTGELLHGSKMRMWHSDKIGTPLSHHSAVKLRQILIAMYKQAVKEGYLNRNLAEDTEPIPLPWHDRRFSRRRTSVNSYKRHVITGIIRHMSCSSFWVCGGRSF